jgi:hypothetical protein
MVSVDHKKTGQNLKARCRNCLNFIYIIMGKSVSRPPNGPSTTGKPSGGGRGNNPPKK